MFEYYSLAEPYLDDLTSRLNDMAKNGWRVVNFMFERGDYVALVERVVFERKRNSDWIIEDEPKKC